MCCCCMRSVHTFICNFQFFSIFIVIRVIISVIFYWEVSCAVHTPWPNTIRGVVLERASADQIWLWVYVIDQDTRACSDGEWCDAVWLLLLLLLLMLTLKHHRSSALSRLYLMNHLMLPASYICAFNIGAVVHMICMLNRLESLDSPCFEMLKNGNVEHPHWPHCLMANTPSFGISAVDILASFLRPLPAPPPCVVLR